MCIRDSLLFRFDPAAGDNWLANDLYVRTMVYDDAAAADTRALLDVAQRTFRPNLVIAAGEGKAAEVVPLLAGRERLDGRAAAYVCRRFVCRRPVAEPAALAAQLDEGQ